MARESAIDALSNDDLDWLNSHFRDKGFCGYEEIASILKQRGYSISKASVHRYGQKMERKLAAVKASTEAAMLITKASPDDADERSQAVLSLVQTEMFNALVALQDVEDDNADPAKRLAMISKCAKGIAEITNASVNQKKWMLEVRSKAEAAASEVEKIIKKSGGLSDETAATIRAQILGIAQ